MRNEVKELIKYCKKRQNETETNCGTARYDRTAMNVVSWRVFTLVYTCKGLFSMFFKFSFFYLKKKEDRWEYIASCSERHYLNHNKQNHVCLKRVYFQRLEVLSADNIVFAPWKNILHIFFKSLTLTAFFQFVFLVFRYYPKGFALQERSLHLFVIF